jgi:MoxR-like ATPase
MRVRIGYPARADERRILNAGPATTTLAAMQPVASAEQLVRLQQAAATVQLADNLQEYLLDIVEATRRHEMLHIGVSPRGALALKRASQAYAMVRARPYVVPDDIKKLAAPVLAHRLVGRALLGGQDGSAEALINDILARIPAPQ